MVKFISEADGMDYFLFIIKGNARMVAEKIRVNL